MSYASVSSFRSKRDDPVRGENNKSRASVLKRSLRVIPWRYSNTPEFAVRWVDVCSRFASKHS
jgi:hypothetical protein